MPKYLLQGVYTDEAARGLAKEGGTKRREVIEKFCAAVGGTLESPVYYGFGERVDVYAIVDLPDHASAAALTITAAPAGAIIKTTVLMDPSEIDDAVNKLPAYRAPGQ